MNPSRLIRGRKYLFSAGTGRFGTVITEYEGKINKNSQSLFIFSEEPFDGSNLIYLTEKNVLEHISERTKI